jgi:hypothetical protein
VSLQELKAVKKAKATLEEKLESEASHRAAAEKHSLQLNNLVQQLKDDVIKCETKIELEKRKSLAADQTWLLEY